jgi:hypothetical protein
MASFTQISAEGKKGVAGNKNLVFLILDKVVLFFTRCFFTSIQLLYSRCEKYLWLIKNTRFL